MQFHNILYPITLLLIVHLHPIYSSLSLSLDFPSKSNTPFLPYLALIQDKYLIFSNQGAYYIKQNSTNDFYFQRAYPEFNDEFLITAETSEYFKFVINSTNTIYIMPYLDGRMFFRTYKKYSTSDDYTAVYDILPGTRPVVQQLGDSYVMFSYIEKVSNRMTIYIVDNNKEIVAQGRANAFLIPNGSFSCNYFKETDEMLCVYSKGTNIVYSIEYFLHILAFDTVLKDCIILDPKEHNDDVIMSIRSIAIDSNQTLNIAYLSPSNLYYLFIGYASDSRINFVTGLRTDIPCTNYIDMNIIEIYDNFAMISGNDGSGNICGFFSFNRNNISKISITGLERCGYDNFRVSIVDDGNIHFVSSIDKTLVYYSQEIVRCVNLTKEVSTNEPIIIDMTELFTPQVEQIITGSGLRLELEVSAEQLGAFYEIDENNTIISSVQLNNTSHFYSRIEYIPHLIGRESYKFSVMFKMSDVFYIPTPYCSISISSSCYSSCETCNYVGNDIEHQCSQCKEGYYFKEQSTSCYSNLQYGYYLDTLSNTYRHCPDNCKLCDNSTSCNECIDDYILLSLFTLNSNDVSCIPFCDKQTSLWFFDADGNFVCLDNTDTCPPDHPCINNIKRQCFTSEDPISNQCTNIIPSKGGILQQFSYIDYNVLNYYKDKFKHFHEDFNVIVYSSDTNSNDECQMSNLTMINIGECGQVIKDEYEIDNDIIVAQIETINDEGKTSPFFGFYLHNGTKIKISHCANTSVNITRPLYRRSSSLSTELIEDLSNKKIDVFNAEDNFFNDKCFNFTANINDVRKADVPINDRRKEYYENTTLCPQNCKYEGVDIIDGKVKCVCSVLSEEDIMFFGEDTANQFAKESVSTSNYEIFKCFKITIKGDIIVRNIGTYAMLVLLVIQFIVFFIYLCYAKSLFSTYIDEKKGLITKLQSNDITSYDEKANTNQDSNIIIYNHTNDTKDINEMFEKRNKGTVTECTNETVSTFKNKKHPEIPIRSMVYIKKRIKEWTKVLEPPKEKLNYDKMEFEVAVLKDTRLFLELLVTRMKIVHPVYPVIAKKTLKIRFISLSMVILDLTTDMFFNALLTTDAYLTKIFKEGYSYLYELPKYFLVALATIVSRCIIHLMIMSLPDEEEIIEESKKDRRFLIKRADKIKCTNKFFYLVIILLTFVFAYFVSAFCAVYQNSRKYWLYGSFTSFIINLLLPFISAFFCTILRRLSFRCNIQFLYHFERLIESC